MDTRSILAIDQGTTSTRVLRIDSAGRVARMASRPVSTSYPANGWAEQDPCALMVSVTAAVAECLEEGAKPAAVAIANQRETVVLWERRSGRPVSPAILWQCRRSEPICSRLKDEGKESRLRELTGLPIDPLFSASKIAWLLENDGELRRRAGDGEIACGTIESWLIWNLTGGRQHVCEIGNAARTQLLDLATCDWNQELLEVFGIPATMLPRLVSSSEVVGHATVAGLEGVPIAGVLGDSHAALAGHGIFGPGAVKATYGTGSSLLTLTGEAQHRAGGLASTIAWYRKGRPAYALEGNITMSGAAVHWLGRFLGLEKPVEEIVAMAATVEDSEGVAFVPAMAGLGAPHWDSEARGMICGLSTSTRLAHLSRAAVESIAFQVRDVFEAIRHEGKVIVETLCADGGAAHNDWLMQFQADLLGCSVLRSSCEDLSAMGAAYFAGLAIGVWSGSEEIRRLPQATDRFEPRMGEPERRRRTEAWRRAVERARSNAA
ncbi:MAG: glycerol kinase GlpK [Acidobacteriaceae bacterium]